MCEREELFLYIHVLFFPLQSHMRSIFFPLPSPLSLSISKNKQIPGKFSFFDVFVALGFERVEQYVCVSLR